MSIASRLILTAVLVGLSGPAAALPVIYIADGKEVHELDVRQGLKEPPAEWKASIAIEDLGRTDLVSSHVVWIKTAENLHYHAKHEATVTLLKGKGTLRIGGKTIALKPGDLITIPKGVVHAFTNESKSPAAAYVVFAPPFDGKDTFEVGEQVK